MAAGKSGGALLACSIGLTKSAPAGRSTGMRAFPADLHCSPVHVCRGAHSTRHVTGVAWATTHIPLGQQQPQQSSLQKQKLLQQPQQRQQQALLMSCGGDGRVKQWRASFEEGATGLVEADCPKAWSSPSLEKDAAFIPGGLAVSGNGLVMAVTADNGTTAIAAVQ